MHFDLHNCNCNANVRPYSLKKIEMSDVSMLWLSVLKWIRHLSDATCKENERYLPLAGAMLFLVLQSDDKTENINKHFTNKTKDENSELDLRQRGEWRGWNRNRPFFSKCQTIFKSIFKVRWGGVSFCSRSSYIFVILLLVYEALEFGWIERYR